MQLVRLFRKLPFITIMVGLGLTFAARGRCAPASGRNETGISETPMEIHTSNGSLAGTLTMPGNAAQVPAILIVPGSGPTDRDGNDIRLGMHTDLYKILAEGLAENNIASLRYDKRGVGASRSTKDLHAPVTADTYIDDVIAAQQAIERVPQITGVFLLGHSEGGLLSILAAQQHMPRGLILLEAPGRPLADVIRQELRSAEIPAPLRARADEIIDQLLHGHHVSDVPKALKPLFPEKAQAFLISLLGVDPAKELAQEHMPTLIIQGTTDLQTHPEDAERLEDAGQDATLVELPNVNHILRHAPATRRANLATYSNPDLPIDPNVIPAITAFVRKHAGQHQ